MLKKSLSALMCFSLCLTVSCSAAAETTVPETAGSSAAETSAQTSAAATATPTPEVTPEETWPEDRYIPFASGHGFSLIEEGYGTEVTDQQSGTCWAHAAATALESNFLYVQSVSIDIDPMNIVDATYGSIAHIDPDRDGFHPRQYSALNVGAGPIQTIAGLANGIESGVVLTEAWDYGELSREQIQEALRTNGAFTIAYLDRDSDYYDIYGYTTINNHGGDEADHSVTLVGWDDDFPAEYFDPPAEENGAWLVQNSFSDRWGSGGYFWLSYETGFEEPFAYAGSTDYSHVCSYDGANSRWIVGDGTVTLANVFEDEGTLGAVGTYTSEPGQEVTVRVYEGELTGGELLAEVTESFEYPGYHTLVLDEPVEVSTFTVVAEYDGSAPVEGESQECYNGDSYIRFEASSEPGQSYILVDGGWVDLTSEDISQILGMGLIPNNACIKALFL